MKYGILANLAMILAISGVLLFVVFSASLERSAVNSKIQQSHLLVQLLTAQVLDSDTPEKMWEKIKRLCRNHSGVKLLVYDSDGRVVGGCGLPGDAATIPFQSGKKVHVVGTGWPGAIFKGIHLVTDVEGPMKHGIHFARFFFEIPPSVFAPAWKFFAVYLALTQSGIFLLGYILFHRTVIGPIADVSILAEKVAGIADLKPGAAHHKRAGSDIQQIATSLRSAIIEILNNREKMESLISRLQTANRDLEAAQQGLIRSEKLAGVGRLAAGVAHEIGNPLQILMGYVELLQRKSDFAEDSDILCRMDQELKRIHDVLQRLLEFARPIRKNQVPCEVNELVQDCALLVKGRKGFRNISFEFDLDRSLTSIITEPEKIRQILVNLIFNSADAMPEEGGTIRASTRKAASGVEIGVSDNGTGITGEDMKKVFDPFFTTKEPGKGTGLGLAVCLGLVESLSGKIDIQSEPGTGTCVTIFLPDMSADHGKPNDIA